MPYDPRAVNFDFSPDQRSLRDQARKFLAEQASSARVRRILEGAAPYDAELWRGMGEMGWIGTAIPEAHGGAGFGYLELCVIAEELGRSLAPTPFSSTIYLATEALLLAGSPAQAWAATCGRSHSMAPVAPLRGSGVPENKLRNAAATAPSLRAPPSQPIDSMALARFAGLGLFTNP
jgi:alkylation response protein AidB-like acyl-CoA dehydrogenase